MEGWFFVVAALLIGAGFLKVRDPAPTQGALAAASLPSGAWPALTLGVGEIVVGSYGLLAGGRLGGVAVAAIYGGFAAFVLVALRRKLPLQSCGCFGKDDTPPSPVHAVTNVLAAVGAIGYALTSAPSLPEVIASQPGWGFPYLVFLAVGVYALYLMLAELPRLRLIVRGPA